MIGCNDMILLEFQTIPSHFGPRGLGHRPSFTNCFFWEVSAHICVCLSASAWDNQRKYLGFRPLLGVFNLSTKCPYLHTTSPGTALPVNLRPVSSRGEVQLASKNVPVFLELLVQLLGFHESFGLENLSPVRTIFSFGEHETVWFFVSNQN